MIVTVRKDGGADFDRVADDALRGVAAAVHLRRQIFNNYATSAVCAFHGEQIERHAVWSSFSDDGSSSAMFGATLALRLRERCYR